MKETTIAKRLVVICAVLIVVTSLFSTAVGYVLRVKQIHEEYEDLSDEHIHHLVNAINKPLWEMDYKSVQNTCEVFNNTTLWMVNLTVTNQDGKTLCSLKKEALSPSIIRHQDINHDGILIGRVSAAFTDELAKSEAFRTFMANLVIIAFIGFSLFVGITWVVRKTISEPMKQFAECMKNIAAGNYSITVSQKSGYLEFSIILREMLHMAEEIKKREETLRTLNEDLTQEIEKREQVTKELIESEAKFRAVMSVASDGVIIAKSDGRIDYSNHAVEVLFGYSGEELRNLFVCDLFSEPDRRLLRKYVLKREQINSSVCEMTGIRKDGATVPVEVSLANTFDIDAPVDRVVAIVRDISWRKEVEREKREALERIYRLQKFEAIGTLASGIAHDFNNILTIIMGYNDLARLASPEDAPVQEYLSQVSHACFRARDLIQQIFVIGRPQPSDVIVFDPGPLIKETVKFLRASIPSSIEIRYHVPDEKILIKANPSQIQQVIMNLCTNSVHAMESSGTGVLSIEMEKISIDKPKSCFFSTLPSGDYIRLMVKDTGCGIPPGVVSRIFDPYFTTKESTRGTGLGLSVVRNIVMSCGGDVEVISELGKGTTIIVYLPIARMEEHFSGAVDDGKGMETKNGGGKCILFVDDERSITDLVMLSLTAAGYRVCAFTDPREALNYFQNYGDEVHLVVSDITMPHIRGDVLAKTISSIRPDVPIILCTGYGFAFSSEELKEFGVRELIYKPFSGKQLLDVINRVLG
ncbi:MAG: ATP-binding protein [Thermodesulforhabdaceae bacterium]